MRHFVVLRAAEGERNIDVAAALGVSRNTVQHWCDRFVLEGLAGLADQPHHPPARLYGPEVQARIVVLACQELSDLGWEGQTH